MTRVGLGFDAHGFTTARPLVIGGVTIPNALGLAGHSDADVLCHAIADAVLGATGLGDLGERFPATSEWKDASSLEILRTCSTDAVQKGWEVVNVDATVVAETPRLAGFRDEILGNIALALDVDVSSVAVKFTTTDGLGFVGRSEGIAAIAVALVERI